MRKRNLYKGKAFDGNPHEFSQRAYDEAVGFLNGQFEFLDPIIVDPLHAETL